MLIWLAAPFVALLALGLIGALALALFGWNWVRGPLQDLALQKTGRELHLGGDLGLVWAWPAPRLRAADVSFANPSWATAPQMIAAEAVELRVDLIELWRGRLTLPEVLLTRPRIFLEQGADGRRTWLLDPAQSDEQARLTVGRMLLDRGELSYVDTAAKTAITATLSTVEPPESRAAARAGARTLLFKAGGRYKGQALAAEGSGGAVLALRDAAQPYPLQVRATLGRTVVDAEGHVTGLLEPTAVDLALNLRGDSLASLYPLIGIALPPTPAYQAQGRLLRSDTTWRYEKFSGKVGQSDLAGTLQVRTGGQRPLLSGELVSRRLALADLGPAVGARPAAAAGKAGAPAARRVLPELPFDTARWKSLDADVRLSAATLLRPEALPLENLQLRLQLQEARLTLDPLSFGLAGGQLTAQVTLDGAAEPLRGRLKAQVRGVKLGKLLPTVDLTRASIGQLNGDIELAGRGASVGRMLASADGRVSLVAQNGEISRLLMEQVGLHLLEILQLSLTGDETVHLNCAVADFDVKAGLMETRALVLDTAVNTLVGSGRIDLAQETLDLTIVPTTKVHTLVALRGPVYVKGSFDKPTVALDAGRIVARGAGALLLGLVNPLLALIPLFEAGPGVDSQCKRLVAEAGKAVPAKAAR